jgi:hypothetical protein
MAPDRGFAPVNRPILHLWPPVVRGLLPVHLPLVAGLIIGGPYTVLGAWVACSILLPTWARSRWVWWFAVTVRRFQTIGGTRAVLHLSPDLANNPFLPILLKTFETRFHTLAGQFGFRLRRPVGVYVFARTQDIANLFGPNYGALALPRLNAIVIAEDCDWEEIAEHELAHLFAARWNPSPPPNPSGGACGLAPTVSRRATSPCGCERSSGPHFHRPRINARPTVLLFPTVHPRLLCTRGELYGLPH